MTTSLALAAHSLRHAARLTLLCLSATLATAGVQAQPVSAKKPSKAPTQARQAKPAPGKRAALPVAPPPLPAAEGEQIAAASLTLFGTYACEFSQTVQVGLNAKNEGYIDVSFGKQSWIMKPVLSSTGALRLEDVKGRILLLQIANKSMLMDTQVGHRIVDECIHEKQRDFNRDAAAAQAASAASAASATQADPAASAASATQADPAASAASAAPAASAASAAQ